MNSIVKGSFLIEAIDSSERVIQKEEGENLVVRTGRVALAKLLGGSSSVTPASVIGNSEITWPVSMTLSSKNNIYLEVDGEIKEYILDIRGQGFVFIIGDYLEQISLQEVVNRLNYQFSTPAQDPSEPPIADLPYTNPAPLVASIEQGKLVITHKVAGITNTVKLAYPEDLRANYNGNDRFFGIATIISPSENVCISDYSIKYIQLGTGNSSVSSKLVPKMEDENFVSPTPCPLLNISTFFPTSEISNQQTKVRFVATLPKDVGNAEDPSRSISYTEAALICGNNTWFAHKIFGQVIKNPNIRLKITWDVEFMP